MRAVATAVSALALAGGVAACGSDDEDSGASDESTEAASAEEVTVNTADIEDGYSWEVEPTPTTEGYTLEEAYELQGRKGSTVNYVEGGARAGETQTFEVETPVEPGNYIMLCPIPGHYELGQLEEGEIS